MNAAHRVPALTVPLSVDVLKRALQNCNLATELQLGFGILSKWRFGVNAS